MPFLFTSGTARGGTNFRTLMLDQHPRVSMAIDPFIPLFRHYRDCLLRAAGREDLLARSKSDALDDYYFSDLKIEIMRTIQEAEPDAPFDMSGWPAVRSALVSRMSLASSNLIPHVDDIPAETFKKVFENCQQIVSRRKTGELSWVGFNDNWAAEFIRPLARLFPDAKFMLHLRDPRAVITSSEYAEPDPRKRPTVMSFARHLRKYIALSQVFAEDPLLQGRLLITRYEPFLADTEAQVRRMTEFLGVDFRPEMLDVSHFRKADGTPWGTSREVYQASGDVWREEMPAPMAELVEFICSPDMELVGYDLERFDSSAGPTQAALSFAVSNAHECLGWRTDFSEIEHTLGCELFRSYALRGGVGLSDAEIARCFLSPMIYERLRKDSHIEQESTVHE